jgi:quinol monooxygenase YgiN
MFRDTVTLIDETVENLHMLAELFADELDTLTHAQQQTPAMHRCREARTAIVALLPKLKDARELQQGTQRFVHSPHCANCEQ